MTISRWSVCISLRLILTAHMTVLEVGRCLFEDLPVETEIRVIAGSETGELNGVEEIPGVLRTGNGRPMCSRDSDEGRVPGLLRAWMLPLGASGWSSCWEHQPNHNHPRCRLCTGCHAITPLLPRSSPQADCMQTSINQTLDSCKGPTVLFLFCLHCLLTGAQEALLNLCRINAWI